MKEKLTFDITIESGSEYPLDISYTDDNDVAVDMTGWTVDAEIREFTGSYDAYPFKTWADQNGVHLYMPAERTGGISFLRGVWDVFITDPLKQTRTKLLSGRATIIEDTARRWR